MKDDLFTSGKISRVYIKLSLPLVFSMLVTLIYNLADTFFVARTQDTALVAGVSLGAPVFTLLMALGNIFGQGGSSLISRLLGRQDKDGVRHASAFCFYVTLIVGVVAGALMLIFRVPILYLIGANEETFVHAAAYYDCLAVGAPVLMLSFIHSNLLRSEGMSRESMIGTVGGALVNIVLDPILIFGANMGARGAAIASVLGYVFSDVFFLFIVRRKSAVLSVNVREMGIPADHARQIFGIGIPAAIVNLMQSASVVLMNQFLLPYGNDKIAAMGIVLKISMIALLLLTGLAFGGQPMFGYYFGANDRERLSQLLRFCVRFIGGISIILTVLLFAAAPLLVRCFLSDDALVREGAFMLRWQIITIPCVSMILLLTIVFQSAGKILGSFLLSISRQGVVFFAALLIGAQILGYTGIIVAQAIADLVTILWACVLFYQQLYREIRPKTT